MYSPVIKSKEKSGSRPPEYPLTGVVKEVYTTCTIATKSRCGDWHALEGDESVLPSTKMSFNEIPDSQVALSSVRSSCGETREQKNA
jgi:hypothetical protein